MFTVPWDSIRLSTVKTISLQISKNILIHFQPPDKDWREAEKEKEQEGKGRGQDVTLDEDSAEPTPPLTDDEEEQDEEEPDDLEDVLTPPPNTSEEDDEEDDEGRPSEVRHAGDAKWLELSKTLNTPEEIAKRLVNIVAIDKKDLNYVLINRTARAERLKGSVEGGKDFGQLPSW